MVRENGTIQRRMGAKIDPETAKDLIFQGLLLGVVHVLTGPDYLAALAAITATQPVCKSVCFGIKWGIGHTIGR